MYNVDKPTEFSSLLSSISEAMKRRSDGGEVPGDGVGGRQKAGYIGQNQRGIRLDERKRKTVFVGIDSPFPLRRGSKATMTSSVELVFRSRVVIPRY